MLDDEMVALLVRLDERTQRIADDVEALKHVVLEGNGSPPLTTQVAKLNERMSVVEDEKKGTAAVHAAWIGGGAAVLAGAIALITQLV